MNLKPISSPELLARTKSLVGEERRISVDVLHHLREIERRRLYAEAGFSSLFSYCVEELKYSAGAAYRRINAMRLMRDCPEIEDAIRDGSLNMSTASAIQSFVTEKPCTVEEKRELVVALKGKSKRECEKIFEAMAPGVAKKTQIEVSDEVLEKLKRLHALTAHRNKSMSELLDWMADQMLPKLEPKITSPANESVHQRSSNRSIPAAIRRAVWARDQGRCQYQDPRTGRRCDSTHALQIDHKIPHAKGGATELRNTHGYKPTNPVESLVIFHS